MTRSRRRKLSRERTKALRTVVRAGVPLASAIVASMPAAWAQQASGGADMLQTIVVTAQKVQENLQNVPISVEVFDNKKLRQLNIVNLDDYVEFAPAISYVRSQGEGGNGEPGSSLIYIRGVVSGGDGNHSGSEPSVGVYLDEQPVTTITGALPLHLYDINRIEVLEGPQGTLFGASSEAGTVRMITNKPDPSKFAAGYNVQGNKVQNGGVGDIVEGYVNLPITNKAAIRLVGWQEHDGGYISNVAGTDANGCIFNGVRGFGAWSLSASGVGPGGGTGQCVTGAPIGAGSITNAPWRAKNYNTLDLYGGRAELRLDLGDHWTVTPTFQGQSQKTGGPFGYDPAVGDLQLVHFAPDTTRDDWTQSALTIEGKVSNFDIVYAGGYVKRNQHSLTDYTDYGAFYDKTSTYGTYYYLGNNGKPIMPQQLVIGGGDFEMWSQELRVTTPVNLPVHATAGVFLERQMHNIWQLYTMPGYGWKNPAGGNPNGFSYALSIPGFPNAIWLTDEQRVDRDKAVYAQATWDITHQLSLTGGLRFYKYDNSLIGFYGFNYPAYSSTGTPSCFEPATVKNAPCNDLDARTSDTGHVPRVNVTYKIAPGKMVYATYSEGFRPGGVNRVKVSQSAANLPYLADFLKNYEVGWKTQWLDNTLRWNGALFWEDWNNFQFSFLGPNSVTIIRNGGNARIKGIETSLDWLPVSNLLLSTNFTLMDPILTQNYYGCIPGTPECTPLPPVETPAGTNLPVTPKFKGNLVARYSFAVGGDWKPYVQLSAMYQSQTSPVLLVSQAQVIGNMPAYALVNLKIGANSANGMHADLFISNLMNRRAQFSRYTESNPSVDSQVYIVPAQPRTFGIEFGQDF